MTPFRIKHILTRRHFFIWFPPLACYAFITYLSSLSHIPGLLPAFPFHDKVGHFLIYFIFGFLVAKSAIWEYAWHPVWKRRLKILILLLITLAGALDEWHQSFVPNRMVDFWDWVADTLGAGAGATLARVLFHLKQGDFSLKKLR